MSVEPIAPDEKIMGAEDYRLRRIEYVIKKLLAMSDKKPKSKKDHPLVVELRKLLEG